MTITTAIAPPAAQNLDYIGETTCLAVSYLRVSTKEQAERGGRDEGFSIPAQREATMRKARDLDAVISRSSSTPGNPLARPTGPNCCA
ncbi:recombinase family protein [Propionibacterium freudenreichii]|uniref:recombinase family protein n=1 Tax=Propionibacterium freudenreichii TaxID=1744 RepID=UPI0021A43FAE|nr:recombinase family protein [Propionibacterium freudenreichii]